MSDKGFVESVNEWGERQFKCALCPTVLWFILDIEDHVNRHKRADQGPAEVVAGEADKWQALGEKYTGMADSIREMRTTVDAMLSRMEGQHPDAVARARREGYEDGRAAAMRSRVIGDNRVARQEARYDTLREILNALADDPGSGYAKGLITDMLKGN